MSSLSLYLFVGIKDIRMELVFIVGLQGILAQDQSRCVKPRDSLTLADPLISTFVHFVESRRRYIMSRSSRGKAKKGIDIGTRGMLVCFFEPHTSPGSLSLSRDKIISQGFNPA